MVSVWSREGCFRLKLKLHEAQACGVWWDKECAVGLDQNYTALIHVQKKDASYLVVVVYGRGASP